MTALVASGPTLARSTWLRPSTVGLVVTGLVTGLWIPVALAEGQDPLAIAAGVVLVASPASVGFLITHFRPSHRLGTLLQVLAGTQATVLLLTSYREWAAASGSRPPLLEPAMLAEFWLWPFPFLGLPLVLLWFADGRPPGRRWHIVHWILWVGVAGVLVSRFIPVDLADEQDLPSFPNPLGIPGAGGLEVAITAMPLAVFVAMLAAVASTVARYRRAGEIERRQLKWFTLGAGVAGMALLVGLGADVLGFPELTEVVALVVPPALMLAIGVAVLRHDLYDVGAVARLLTATTLTSAALTAGFVGLAVALGRVASDLAAATAGALAIAGAAPYIHRRVRGVVERRFAGDRSHPLAMVRGLRSEAGQAPPDRLADALAATAVARLRLPHATVEVRDADGGAWRVVAEAGAPATPLEWSTEIRHGGTVVGRLQVAPRSAGVPLDARDTTALRDLAEHAAPLVVATRLAQDLVQTRDLVGRAAGDERQRLRRDLHDGLGSSLTGIRLGMAGLAERAPELRDELADVAADIELALSELDRLVDGLAPVALVGRHLGEAIEELADPIREAGVDVAVAVPDQLVPPAYEIALYRIAAEALTNVAKHAGARSCTVRLDVGDEVCLTVADDGRGAAPGETGTGVGLTSMLERCRQHGGDLSVQPGPSGGTVVQATLPLPPA